jgi:riboflavin kinase / FMN adenylyltransferase
MPTTSPPSSKPRAASHPVTVPPTVPPTVRMTVIDRVDQPDPRARGCSLAIGNFDGVHRGHQALLEAVKADAAARSAPAGVMIFDPHPREFFQPAVPHFRLTSRAEKLRLFERIGLDIAVVLPFDAALAALTPEAFVSDILVTGLGVGHVVIGYDFNFGKGRAGTPDTMRAAGNRHGFAVTVVDPVREVTSAAESAIYSSSAVRAKLGVGDVAGAALALGHRWRIDGRVVGGAKRGTGLGFPTANITVSPGCGLAHGIYAVRVHVAGQTGQIGGETHLGAAYWGSRPQFDNGLPVLEVFLLDFDGNLYGRDLSVEFAAFIRPDGKFEGVEALKIQMQADCDAARRSLMALALNDPLVASPLA